MPSFSYTCVDDNGIELRGVAAAETEDQLAARLRRQGQYLVRSTPASETGASLDPVVRADHPSRHRVFHPAGSHGDGRGDIGRLPSSFQELAQRGSLPVYATSTTRNVGMGWRGPYVNIGTSPNDYLNDAFGHAYIGASSGQVRSAGPDGVSGNADDIVYPPAAPPTGGTVTVTVKTVSSGKTLVDPAGYRVELFYANSGAEASLGDVAAPFSFNSVPMGVHVQVVKTSNPGSGNIVAQDTIVVGPSSTTAAELWF